MLWVIVISAFAFGAIVGSFLNVVIHRYPREESIVFPSSRCPHCQAPIRPYDNVPVLSYLWLRGRCRDCRQPISIRYPLVELANALFYVAVIQRTGLSLLFLPIAAIVSMIIVLIYIDADIQILPDAITIPGIAIGLVLSFIPASDLAPFLTLATSWRDSLLGAGFGAGLLSALILAYWLIRRVEGMGWGDVKMMALIGAILGFASVPAVLLLASVAGALIGVPLALRHEKGMQFALPFGVFLGFATLAVLFFGHTLFELWVRFVLFP